MSEKDPDSNLDPEALYKTLPDTDPPAELDQKVLAHAAARRSSQANNRGEGRRWDAFGRRFAAAAVVILAVGIFFQSDFGPDIQDEPLLSSRSESTAQSLSPAQPPSPAAADKVEASEMESSHELEEVAGVDEVPVVGETRQTAEFDAVRDVFARTPPAAEEREDLTATASRPEVKHAKPNQQKRERLQLTKAPLPAPSTTESTTESATEDAAPENRSAMIEEVVVTGAMLASSERLSIQLCEPEENCRNKIAHEDCEEPFEIPIDAQALEIEEDVVIFTSQERDHFVRCLKGTWTTQSQSN